MGLQRFRGMPDQPVHDPQGACRRRALPALPPPPVKARFDLPPALPFAPQGAQIMSQYGVNVPPGIPVFKVDQVAEAAKKMADEAGEVRTRCVLRRVACGDAPLPRCAGFLQRSAGVCLWCWTRWFLCCSMLVLLAQMHAAHALPSHSV